MTTAPRRSAARLALLVVGGLAAAAVVALFPTARYATRSSAACGSCHAGASATPGHEAVSCQGCHPVGVAEGLGLTARGLVGARGAPPHGRTDAARCQTCHVATGAPWLKVAGTEGHRRHAGVAGVGCLSCHAKEAHGKSAAAESCTACHDEVRLHAKAEVEAGRGAGCVTCHNFSARSPAEGGHAQLTREACASCHGPDVQASAAVQPGPAVRADDLHGGVDCKLCHQPHASVPGARPCRSCHQVQLLSGRPNLPPEHLECDNCHQQHRPVALAGAKCAECHEQAKSRAGARKGEATALKHDECASCHLPHTWAAAPNDCVTCHRDEATAVSTRSPPRHQRCTNCHAVHGEPPSGATCGTCHKDNARKLATGAAPAKHKDCTSCHDSHAPGLTVPQGCAGCHQAALAQVVSQGPEDHRKANCDGCHTLHGDPRATTRGCVECHKKEGALAARAGPPKHQACASCHLAHRFTFDPKQPSCSVSCHTEVTLTTGTHDGACSKCHAPHGAPGVTKEKCLGCHDKVKVRAPEKAPEHGKCSSCHQPHASAKAAQARCASCHEEKLKVAQVWPARSAHRDGCHECHKAHDAKAPVQCGGCHEKAQAGAVGGKHECKQCHAPHQPPATSTKGWWNRCVACHEKEATASKAHARCDTCHEPHAFKVPACISCHAKEANQAAHREKEHRVCTKCHDAHSGSKPTRAQCIACHQDRAQHEPKVSTCTGCHPFKD